MSAWPSGRRNLAPLLDVQESTEAVTTGRYRRCLRTKGRRSTEQGGQDASVGRRWSAKHWLGQTVAGTGMA